MYTYHSLTQYSSTVVFNIYVCYSTTQYISNVVFNTYVTVPHSTLAFNTYVTVPHSTLAFNMYYSITQYIRTVSMVTRLWMVLCVQIEIIIIRIYTY